MTGFRSPSFVAIGVLFFGLLGVEAPSWAQLETRGASHLQLNASVSVAVGDFNHDGKLDLAVADLGGYVSILLGNGDGTFGLPAYYKVAGPAAWSIVAADFNHDGNLDLAVATDSNSMTVLMGKGDGTFRETTVTVSAFPVFVAVGDFNGDGKPDLMAMDNGNPCQCLIALLGNGDGSFQAPVYTHLTNSIQALAVGDFNGDGKSDLITAGTFGAANYVNVLLGNGDGTFQQGASYPGQGAPVSAVAADFNGDGKLDVAIADLLGVGVEVLLGNGDGTFQGPAYYQTSFPAAITVADFNGDHKLDLAVANFGAPGGAVGILLGNGDGTFQPSVSYPAGEEISFVAVGDFNGDLKPDVVASDTVLNRLPVLLNTGVVSFSPTTPLNFKKQAVGTTSAPQTVTLTNTGTTALKISSMKATGQFGMTSTCGSGVAPGANCTVSVTFSPKTKGAKSGTVTINNSASSKPQVIELSGTGT